ncbi:MAG TPA: 3-phosphoshikimate 1-carboxyvinyltransferase [Terriglobales bacterium]|nr:3-phosphoshikimate 1-carboxyvinyltransferase [Terriglobales bacterium]
MSSRPGTEVKTEPTVIVRPARNVAGALRLPGDKSISHRYAMLAAIAEGTTRLENYSTGADCASTLACLQKLGCRWECKDQSLNIIEIHGKGPQLSAPRTVLDCGNSGSTMRMLSGILAGQPFTSELTGDESLLRRPMARIIAPLTEMGAEITAHDGNLPPLRISGGRLKAIDYSMPVPSAQVKSCILLAGLLAAGFTRVMETVATRDHTELALRAFGAQVDVENKRVSIRGGQNLQCIHALIPGDLSSAAFFLCAAALFPDSHLMISGLLMNPTRARLLDVLTRLGMGISVTQIEEQHGEAIGTLDIRGKALKGVTLSGAESAALIDELPVLAAIAPYTESGIEIRDARELRVKESDRIAVTAANLRAMGARVEELEDGLRIPGGQSLHGAEIDSHGDHRIAMAFAIAALRAHGETRITGADAADVSYPGFFYILDALVQR